MHRLPARVVLLCCLLLVPAAAVAAQSFAPTVKVTVGRGPSGLVLADFDGNGALDLATSDLLDNTVTVRLGDGAGLFLPKLAYPVDVSPYDLAAGDLDGDGAPDLLVTCNGQNFGSLVLLRNRNDGSGTFLAAQSFPLPLPVSGDLELGDLDGDGDLDALLAAMYDDHVHVLLNDGDGAFAQSAVIVTVARPCTETFCFEGVGAVRLADLDEDGDLDFAVTNLFEQSFATFLNDGHAVFVPDQRVLLHVSVGALVLADVNEDGHVDALVSDTFVGAHFMAGNGSGGFSPPVTSSLNTGGPFSTALIAITLADLDGNGTLDIAGTHSGFGGNDVRVASGNGSGLFGPVMPVGAIGPLSARIVAADLDQDGRPDLLAPDSGSSSDIHSEVSILHNTTQVPAPWTDLGGALAGSDGQPRLMPAGTLQAGTPLALVLTSAKAGAPAFLVLGFSVLGAPFKGGVLAPYPNVIVGGLFVEPNHELVLGGTWPAGAPSALPVVAQWWITDVAGPVGLAASNGVEAFTP